MDREQDRQSEEFARQVAERTLPEAAPRRRALKLLAGAVRRAHGHNPQVWGLTVRAESMIRLNVGRLQTLVLEAGRLRLNVDWETLPEPLREQVRDWTESPPGGYKVLTRAVDLLIPAADLPDLDPALPEANLRLIDLAAGTAARTPYYRSHSPGALAYLRAELGEDFPDPDYVEGDVDPWDAFVRWAIRFFRWDGFDADERDYKLEFVDNLGAARDAAAAGDSDWLARLKHAFGPPYNLTPWRTTASFVDWCKSEPSAAKEALAMLWDDEREVPERFRRFLDRVGREVISGRGTRLALASALGMAVDPTRFPVYRVTPFEAGLRLTAYPGPPEDADEVAVYEHALGFLERIREEISARGVEIRDRLDAQGLLWTVTQGGNKGDVLPAAEFEALCQYRGDEAAVWWVNQGEHYQEEMAGGYLWAPLATASGAVVAHHFDVSRLRQDHVVVHYASGQIRALSRVTGRPGEGQRPGTGAGDEVGRRARAHYFELPDPIALEAIREELREPEAGPFTQKARPKQGYLFQLSAGFARELRELFADRWPAGSPWRTEPTGRWLFQANPKYWDLKAHLPAQPGGEETWLVTRYRDQMQAGDEVVLWQAGSEAGVYALGRLIGEPALRQRSEWRQGDDQSEWSVSFRYTEIAAVPLRRESLLSDPVLKNLAVIRSPAGTNFRVTDEQWAAIRSKLKPVPPPDLVREVSFAEIRHQVNASGLKIEERTLRRFHLSLRTRGFVVLSGVSGSGKTWLTQVYARAVGAACCLVAVAPNWTANEDLLGYQNPLDGHYHHTTFSRFLKDAAGDYAEAQKSDRNPRLHLLVLDEMNLARVEHYFAKFLSAMEVRARDGSAPIELGPEETVDLTPNLLFVGTINVDETTHGFADKVYDRAQLIELEITEEMIAEHLGSAAYKEILLEVWRTIHRAAPFAFRVLDEIRQYVEDAEEMDVPWQEALDEQLLQKVLPKLGGAEGDVTLALEGLLDLAQEPLPLTAAKAWRMLQDLRDHGFASFF